MLKLSLSRILPNGLNQPPLGGCVLKPRPSEMRRVAEAQPPLGGCVLKQYPENNGSVVIIQPPLGGCVLKLSRVFLDLNSMFSRL